MMLPTLATDAPPLAYVSTLIEGSVPRPERIGSVYVPDSSWNDIESITLETLTDRTLNTPLSDLASDIRELLLDPEEDAPPSSFAVSQALSLSSAATTLLGHKWPKPRVSPDGAGGLRLSWRNGRKELRAVIAGTSDKERYLYWEDETGYGSVANFTEITLFTFLDKRIVPKGL
jgi:hypothetical protein